MLRHLGLIALFFRVNLQNEAAYRLDFFLRLVVAVLQLAGELLAVWTIFSNTPSVAGWNATEMLVLLGVFRLMHGLIGLVIAPNMRRIMEDIRTGALDFALIKPVSSQFLVSFRQIVVWKGADILLGLGLALVAGARLGAQIGPLHALQFAVNLAAGAVIIYSFWLALATTCFWFTRINNIEMVFWNVFEAGRYPIDIYRPWIRWTLTYIIPLAFLTTFPAASLAGRGEDAAAWAGLVAAPLTLLAATAFWRFGLRRYSGASA